MAQALHPQSVSLGISSDNRTLTPITVTHEYEKLAATFGWSKTDFLKCNISAIHAAFVPDSIKEELVRRVAQAYGPM